LPSTLSSKPLPSDYTVPGVEVTQGESLEDLNLDQNGEVAIWVGMILPMAIDVPKGRGRKGAPFMAAAPVPVQAPAPARRSQRRKGKGKTKDTPEAIEVEPKALRVVVSIAKTKLLSKMFALVNPENGVCEGFTIPAERCFFFLEFRDDNVSKCRRPKNLRECSHPRLTKDMAVLEEVIGTLERMDPDVQHLPSTTHWALRKLLGKAKITRGEGSEALVIQDIETLWPPFTKLMLRDEDVVYVSRGLRAMEGPLEYRLARPFLAEIIPTIRDSPSKKNAILGELTITPAITMPDTLFATFLDRVISRNDEMICYGKRYDQAVQDWIGDNFTGTDYHEIASTFQEVRDVDSAKAWMLQAQKLTAKASTLTIAVPGNEKAWVSTHHLATDALKKLLDDTTERVVRSQKTSKGKKKK
ncbi:MAG: hypothetical protein Q9174_005831, partial [Haloplaca sp. 1 TL-2023]